MSKSLNNKLNPCAHTHEDDHSWQPAASRAGPLWIGCSWTSAPDTVHLGSRLRDLVSEGETDALRFMWQSCTSPVGTRWGNAAAIINSSNFNTSPVEDMSVFIYLQSNSNICTMNFSEASNYTGERNVLHLKDQQMPSVTLMISSITYNLKMKPKHTAVTFNW